MYAIVKAGSINQPAVTRIVFEGRPVMQYVVGNEPFAWPQAIVENRFILISKNFCQKSPGSPGWYVITPLDVLLAGAVALWLNILETVLEYKFNKIGNCELNGVLLYYLVSRVVSL